MRQIRSVHRALVIGLFCGLPCAQTLFADGTLPAAFGRVTEIPVSAGMAGFLMADVNGDGYADIILHGARQLAILRGQEDRQFERPSYILLPYHIDEVISADVDRDGKTDLIIVSRQRNEVRTYLGKEDTLRIAWSERLRDPIEAVVVADVNTDGIPDLLFHGRRGLGISVMLGRGDGSFRPPRQILAEFSFSNIAVADANSDRVVDVVGVDWVNNQLLLFTGFGRLRFSSPSAVVLKDTPIAMAVGRLSGTPDLDIAVLDGASRMVTIYGGDGLGQFEVSHTIAVPFTPLSFSIADVDGNGINDVIVFSEKERSFSVHLRNESGHFLRPLIYGAGSAPGALQIYTATVSSHPNAIVLDRGRSNLIIYHNVHESAPRDVQHSYGVGLRPTGICSIDVNRNGKIDLLVAHYGSDQISLFLNRGDGSFQGQLGLPGLSGADAVRAVRRNDTSFVVFTSHPELDKVVAIDVAFPSLFSRIKAVPTLSRPELLDASISQVTGYYSVVVRGQTESSTAVTLSRIVELDRERIIEQPVYRHGEVRMIAVEMADLNGDGFSDVIFVAKENGEERGAVKVAFGRADGQFELPQLNFFLPDTGIRSVRIWLKNRRVGFVPELIFHIESIEQWLALSRWDNGAFSPIYQRFPEVVIRRHDDVTFTDVDGDGIDDLVVANSHIRAIQVYLGQDDGTFSPPERLMSFPSSGGIVVADFNRDGAVDYAVTYSESDMVRVYLGR